MQPGPPSDAREPTRDPSPREPLVGQPAGPDPAAGEPATPETEAQPPSTASPGAATETRPGAWEAQESRRRATLLARVFAGILLLAVFVVFVSLNSDSVPVHFIFAETSAPLAWVFLICALIGAIVTYLLGRPGRRATRKYIKELERRLEGRETKS